MCNVHEFSRPTPARLTDAQKLRQEQIMDRYALTFFKDKAATIWHGPTPAYVISEVPASDAQALNDAVWWLELRGFAIRSHANPALVTLKKDQLTSVIDR